MLKFKMNFKTIVILIISTGSCVQAVEIEGCNNSDYFQLKKTIQDPILGLNLNIIHPIQNDKIKNKIIQFEVLKSIAEKNKDKNAALNIKNLEFYLNNISTDSEDLKIKKVNNFFNEQYLYQEDQAVWNKVDYWSTPFEFLNKKSGDCEDFAVMKYLALIYVGVPQDKLKISYVRIHNKNSSLKDESHMVLKYLGSSEEDPLILDSQVKDIYPSKKRIDLINVYDFDLNHMYVHGESKRHSIDKISRWKDYLERAKIEGSIQFHH